MRTSSIRFVTLLLLVIAAVSGVQIMNSRVNADRMPAHPARAPSR